MDQGGGSAGMRRPVRRRMRRRAREFVLSFLIATLRRSTAGLAFTAMRDAPISTSTMGISVVRMKVFIAAAGAIVAGIGGGLLAMSSGAAVPTNFPTLFGLTWMAVLVTIGVRSNAAALLGGLSYAYIPAIFATYLSTGWQQVSSALFGLGAILVASNPDGVLADNARKLEALLRRRETGPAPAVATHEPGGSPVPSRRNLTEGLFADAEASRDE